MPLNQQNCRICNLPDPPNNHFFSCHRLSQAEYYSTYFPKSNLLTQKPKTFKDKESYFLNDFDSREELNSWIKTQDQPKVNKYLVDYLARRKEVKGIKTMFGQFEAKSLQFPSISWIIKKYGLRFFESIVKEAGLVQSYQYGIKLEYFNVFDHIICDTREQKPLEFENMVIQKLDVGDYAPNVNPQNISVDRKSLADGISTLSPQNIERFEREIVRAADSGKYIVLMIENSYQDLSNFNKLKQISKKIKASPDFILHNARLLLQKYDNLQVLCVNGRHEMKRIVKRLFELSSPIYAVDLQYLYDNQLL